jgi:hypothetical protein
MLVAGASAAAEKMANSAACNSVFPAPLSGVLVCDMMFFPEVVVAGKARSSLQSRADIEQYDAAAPWSVR